MPDFRRWIIALAVVALFAGLASAQVNSSNSPFTCAANVSVTPTVRSEGYTELVGDIVLTCTGGNAALALGSPIPTANITVFLNTAVTSRLLGSGSALNPSNASEALLLVDEPGGNVGGYGPTVPQTVCATPAVGAGAGGCAEQVGTGTIFNSSLPAGSNVGVPVSSTGIGASPTFTGTPGANVFQGLVTGNQVSFQGIPALPPVTAGSARVYRITNIRVNANGISAGGPTPGAVTASVSTNGSSSLAISTSTLTVAFVQPGLTAKINTASGGTAPVALAQCNSLGIGVGVGLINFTENFATAFKTQFATETGNGAVAPGAQNVPGTIYNSESGFIQPAVTGVNTSTGVASVAGRADFGTRLKATFTNVPSGVSLFVSVRDITNGASALPTAPATFPGNAVLVVSENSGSPNGVVPSVTQTAALNATGANTNIGYAPVAVNTATGSGSAVWEVLHTNPAAIDSLTFGVFASFTANVANNSPAVGTIGVTLSFAPTPAGGGFTTSTGPAASATLPIPRFSDSLAVQGQLLRISICQTVLLFPYVTNAAGLDTGIAIANTSTDPLGTAAQSGTCSLTFYGTGAPTTQPGITANVASGAVYANTASSLSPGFTGYMFAVCNFQWAHGFAFISDVGLRNLAMGYLALIVNNGSLSRGQSAESLNN